MKKILHVISQRPNDTGSGVYLQNLIANGNQNNVCQAVVFGVNRSESIKIDIAEKWIYEMKFESSKISFPVVGMSDVMPYKSSVFSELSSSKNELLIDLYKTSVKKAILDFQPDVIFCQHLWLITSITKNIVDELRLDIAVYGFCHGTDLRQFELSKLHREMVLSGCSKLNAIFALNEYQVEEISKIYSFDRSKIHLIGNGYNSTYFYKDEKISTNKKQRVIYAGKLSYSKGLMSLINAFKTIDSSKFELFIAGSGHGEEYSSIIELVSELDNVFYLGKLSQSELGDEFRKSDIFVLPSFYEGLPLVIIEAIACGLKIVYTNINGVSKWINKFIGRSDAISSIDLPKMLGVDEPDPNDLFDYEKRLAESIVKVSKETINDFDYSSIYELKWKSIFRKINDLVEQN